MCHQLATWRARARRRWIYPYPWMYPYPWIYQGMNISRCCLCRSHHGCCLCLGHNGCSLCWDHHRLAGPGQHWRSKLLNKSLFEISRPASICKHGLLKAIGKEDFWDIHARKKKIHNTSMINLNRRMRILIENPLVPRRTTAFLEY